jgi:acyl transferase domain-containing protein
VIHRTAINSDGARKVGYFAPSVAGQAEALAVADIPADSISYIKTRCNTARPALSQACATSEGR